MDEIDQGLAPAMARIALWREFNDEHATHEGTGLPVGWHLLDTLTHQDTRLGLVQREAGGWAAVEFRDRENLRPLLFALGDSLTALHQELTNRRNPRCAASLGLTGRALTGLYDAEDPAEAGEAVLVALGGRVRMRPKADLIHTPG